MKKIFYALVASALLFLLTLADIQAAPATHDEHAHAPHDRMRQANVSRARRRQSKTRRRSVRRTQLSYACPMHPDMRSRSRGECPKCGMALVVGGGR